VKPTDPEPNTTDILLQIAQTLAAVQGQAQSGADVHLALDKMTQTLAELATRTRPENPEHSGISAYSNPLGDYKDPKPPLQCEILWVGYPLTLETLTPLEVSWVNRLRPIETTVTKGNGNVIPFKVEGKKRIDGTYERLEVSFPCKGDQSTDHRSMIDYCAEALGEKLPTLRELQAELERVKRELAAAHEVINA
jgi:hypothetical protein